MWKAHGTAGFGRTSNLSEPRSAGLFQADRFDVRPNPKAVLEQPSSSRMSDNSLGRRNIAPAQSTKLNQPPRSAWVVSKGSRDRKRRGASEAFDLFLCDAVLLPEEHR